MKLSPRDQLIAVAVVAVLIVGALFALLVVPMFGKLRQLDDDIANSTSQVQMAKAQLAKRQEIKNNAAVTGDTLLQLANAVPENPELPALIIDLQDAAYDADVQLTAVTPEGSLLPGQGFAAIPIEITIVGEWANTIDYLQGLRALTRQLRIVSFSSTRSDALAVGLGLPPYTPVTNITLDAYVIPSASSTSTAPATPAPAPAQ